MELNELWKSNPCSTVRRLLIEIARLRNLVVRSAHAMDVALKKNEWGPRGGVINSKIIEDTLAELRDEPVVREAERKAGR